MDLDLIHLQSRFKGLRVAADGGKMDYAVNKGRSPRVERPPAFITFERGMAVVARVAEKAEIASYETFGAKTRAEAIAKIKKLNGYSTDFTIVDEFPQTTPASRSAVGASA